MYKVKSICVQCGSSGGNVESFKEQAYRMGELLASEGIRLIYGGSNIGLMGAVARGCLENGGEVVAIIPEKIKNMVDMLDVSELIVVQTMHERKAKMNELADAFIAMPGGFGTLEELFEVLTWNQLHYISKPVALYNIENYYNTLIDFLQVSVESGFIRQEHLEMLLCENNPAEILRKFAEYKPVQIAKWWD